MNHEAELTDGGPASMLDLVEFRVRRPVASGCATVVVHEKGQALAQFLVVRTRGVAWRILELADVVLHESRLDQGGEGEAGRSWLARLPGCGLVVVHDGSGTFELQPRGGLAQRVRLHAEVPDLVLRCGIATAYLHLSGLPGCVPDDPSVMRIRLA